MYSLLTKIILLDDYVGDIIAFLKENNIEENTLIIFTSDSGPAFEIGGADSAFFESANLTITRFSVI